MTLQTREVPRTSSWLTHNLPPRWPQGSMQHVYLRAINQGQDPWPTGDGFRLSVLLNGQPYLNLPMPHEVPAGESAVFDFPFIVPLAFFKADPSTFAFLLIDHGGAKLETAGQVDVTVDSDPAESDAVAEAVQLASFSCTALYLPTGGVTRSRDGTVFPTVAKHAAGCRIRDLAGNQWIDYVMGWGSALLGYSHPEITAAISEQLASGSVLGLPHLLELEVAQLLGDLIPCAETTLFGKNGSDVCTAAVRLARIHTGRPVILFSGYSGWQEPFAQHFEPSLISLGHNPSAFDFPLNDLDHARRLFDEHAGNVAAVMLEPAAQIQGVDGPIPDVDPAFLSALATLCQQHGSLLIFDEIMTGFRYSSGSVQKATGVTPDLACFGKALTSAMPLSVLVGKREIMRQVGRAFYHPTFKGEAYSLAAAAAALRIYRDTDVPAKIHQFGTTLMTEIDCVSRDVGVAGKMVGLPFRMVYRFDEPSPHRRKLMRTLLHQELLKRGVLTFRGCMLPSSAHGQPEMDQTIEAFRHALAVVARVTNSDSFESALEIPPLV